MLQEVLFERQKPNGDVVGKTIKGPRRDLKLPGDQQWLVESNGRGGFIFARRLNPTERASGGPGVKAVVEVQRGKAKRWGFLSSAPTRA